jgi:hypothetical protein
MLKERLKALAIATYFTLVCVLVSTVAAHRYAKPRPPHATRLAAPALAPWQPPADGPSAWAFLQRKLKAPRVGQSAEPPLAGERPRVEFSLADYPRRDNPDFHAELEVDDLPRFRRLLADVAASSALYGPGGVGVYIPPGDYFVGDTLEITGLGGVRFHGSFLGSRVYYTGPAGRPAVLVAQCFRCTFEDLCFFTTTKGTSHGLLVTNLPGDHGWVSSACLFRNLIVGVAGGGGGDVEKAVSIDNTARGGGDTNNEHHRFERVLVSGYSRCGFHQLGSNVHAIVYDGCECYGDSHEPHGQYGLECEYGCFFRWQNGFMTRHAGYDFQLSDFMVGVSIDGFNGEWSEGFIRGNGVTGSPMPIAVANCRWDGVPVAGKSAVQILQPGPLRVQSCRISSLTGVWPIVGLGTFVPYGAVLECNHIVNLSDPAPPSASVFQIGGPNASVREFANIHQSGGGIAIFNR